MCYFGCVMQYENWQNFIEQETKKTYFQSIKKRLIEDNSAGKIIHPEPKLFFKAFEICNLNNLKIVILGQDPYHTPATANGLAFSVQKHRKVPPSLVNIFKELDSDLGIKNYSGDLSYWAEQGVLLLNTSLTVIEGEAGSHSKIGWEIFTDEVIKQVQSKNNIIFLLWGNHARKKKELIGGDNFVFEAAHPSPLSAHNGFFGCKHFSQANEKLIELGSRPIDWQLA